MLENPCVICGEADITVLEFDHCKGDKRGNIAELIGNGNSWQVVEEEIEKCQVLCANCHRRKTAIDQQWFVLEYLEKRFGAMGKVVS